MFFQEARVLLQEALDIVLLRGDRLLDEGRTAMDILGDVARYARGRVREQYLGEPSDPVATIVDAFILDACEQLIEGKKAAALAIADDKRIFKLIELEQKNVEEWEKRSLLAAQGNDPILLQETLECKRRHQEKLDTLVEQWKKQHALASDLKMTLLRLNQVIELAKCTKARLKTNRFARRADELKKQVERMDQIVKGLELLTEFDRSSRSINEPDSSDR
jgi:phage shock protein A